MSQTLATEKPSPARKPKVPWWRRPWIIPLWLISVVFIIMRTPNYLGFTPENSLVELRDYQHYLIISGHIVLGSVALVACCMQLWPRLRADHPKLHRVTGRIYVAVVIPASVLALFTSFLAVATPPSGRYSNAILAVLWLVTTLLGFHHARNRRFADHRRWMIRSFALCFSIIMSRVWITVFLGAFLPFMDSFYGGDQQAYFADIATAASWSSWTTTLVFAEWWMTRRRKPRKSSAVTA